MNEYNTRRRLDALTHRYHIFGEKLFELCDLDSIWKVSIRDKAILSNYTEWSVCRLHGFVQDPNLHGQDGSRCSNGIFRFQKHSNLEVKAEMLPKNGYFNARGSFSGFSETRHEKYLKSDLYLDLSTFYNGQLVCILGAPYTHYDEVIKKQFNTRATITAKLTATDFSRIKDLDNTSVTVNPEFFKQHPNWHKTHASIRLREILDNWEAHKPYRSNDFYHTIASSKLRIKA